MSAFPHETVPSLLVRDLPRDLVMAVEDALCSGASRAFAAAHGTENGHLPNVVGQLRHFKMNEAFHRVLVVNNAAPTPIRGNSLITGQAGVFTIGRFNVRAGSWINSRRSSLRQQMALANAALEPLVQSSLFDQYRPPTSAAVFFVACFSSSLSVSPDVPLSIHIAVPDRALRGWLFREPINDFLQRYEPTHGEIQPDLAKPRLKKRPDAMDGGGSA